MQVKLIEVQDRATCIAALAIRPGMPLDEGQGGYDGMQLSFLLGKCGFDALHAANMVLFGRLEGGSFTADPYDWNDRTMQTAHAFIEEHWDTLVNGSIVDVRVILGERPGGMQKSDVYWEPTAEDAKP